MADQQPIASDLYAPYATREEFNLHFLDHYEEGIRTLFEQEKFENLDLITDTARSTKARLPATGQPTLPGCSAGLHSVRIQSPRESLLAQPSFNMPGEPEAADTRTPSPRMDGNSFNSERKWQRKP